MPSSTKSTTHIAYSKSTSGPRGKEILSYDYKETIYEGNGGRAHSGRNGDQNLRISGHRAGDADRQGDYRKRLNQSPRDDGCGRDNDRYLDDTRRDESRQGGLTNRENGRGGRAGSDPSRALTDKRDSDRYHHNNDRGQSIDREERRRSSPLDDISNAVAARVRDLTVDFDRDDGGRRGPALRGRALHEDRRNDHRESRRVHTTEDEEHSYIRRRGSKD